MLKKIRLTLAAVLLALITFYFLDFAEVLPQRFHVLAQIQFVPALLSLSIGILIALLVLTLLFGRVYCSVICPMGIYQDVVAWFAKRLGKKKKKYSYSPAKNILRWVVLVVTIVAFFGSAAWVVALLDPYSAFGRMATNVLKPVYMMGNNVLESIFSRFNNYTFYQVDASVLDWGSFGVAMATLLVVGYLAYRHGRTWCNTICPVGTVLGFLSRFSLFKVRLDRSKCNHCGLCATKCKAACIDSKESAIDYSRCVDCFNCLSVCKKDALVYAPYQKCPGTELNKVNASTVSDESVSDTSRRRFLTGVVTTAAASKVLAQVAEEPLALLSNQKAYKREHPITPPGSVGREHFQKRCTSCHLCVSKCPSHVLKPAFAEYGMEGIMQPTVYYEKGFCNFNCTVCGEVCPTGAILPLTKEEKRLTQMGHVVFIEENCIPHTEGTSCGACSEHCPTQAVKMVPYRDGLTIPQVDTTICVGCGGCEFICPVRPYRAIYVEGNPVHIEAKPFVEEKKEEIEIDGFGF